MPKNRKAPVLFVGHGSPMNAIENNSIRRGWRDMGKRLGKPRAIVAVSAGLVEAAFPVRKMSGKGHLLANLLGNG